jgi:hypothetical protein
MYEIFYFGVGGWKKVEWLLMLVVGVVEKLVRWLGDGGVIPKGFAHIMGVVWWVWAAERGVGIEGRKL